MDTFYLISIMLLGLMLIYLVIKNQVVKMVEERLHFMYREKIESDIQDIYREFESYSSIIDSRIQRLKTLTERQESSVKAWENIQNDIKKTKAGKDLLNHLEAKQKRSEPDAEALTQLKKEIISELKTYLAQKLNLGVQPYIQRPEKPASTVASSLINERKPVTKKTIPDDFNVAELIIDDMVSRIQDPNPVLKSEVSPSIARQISKPEKSDANSSSQESGGFFKVMASVGRALSPIFMKSSDEPSTSEINLNRNPAPKGNFNDLIKKEMKTSRQPVEVIGRNEIRNAADKLPIPSEEKVSVQTSLDPGELVRLIDDLKNSRLRPTALKNLISRGFDLNQIAELSNIPYSDLELTRNLYRI